LSSPCTHCLLSVTCHRLLRGFLERRKRLIVLLVITFVGGVLFLTFFCPNSLCSTASNDIRPGIISQPPSMQTEPRSREVTLPRSMPEVDLPPIDVELSDKEVERTFSFDADHDVLVFLHAQKTGGSTFGRHLVRDTTGVGIPSPCVCQRRRKRCECSDSRGRQWLFSRYTSGWVCGLHADWTELHDCVPRYLDKREDKKRQRRLYFFFLCVHFLFDC